MKYIIANWKAHKNVEEIDQWFREFFSLYSQNKCSHQIIIAPPSPYLQYVKEKIKGNEWIKIAAQSVSTFDHGPYTGEVTATMIHDFAEYVIVGHSERRTLFHETNEGVIKQAELVSEQGIRPIVCIRDENDLIPYSSFMVAYEPVEAIGTGQNADIADVLKIKSLLAANMLFLYGGSVNKNNAKEYLSRDEIDGLLVGTASLDAKEFFEIITSV